MSDPVLTDAELRELLDSLIADPQNPELYNRIGYVMRDFAALRARLAEAEREAKGFEKNSADLADELITAIEITAKSEAQLAEALAKADRLREQNVQLSAKVLEVALFEQERAAQLAEAREDTERLDWWIEQTEWSWPVKDAKGWWLCSNERDVGPCKTLRAALDAAQAKGEKP
jgi:hypothetical protein